jgi:hypothetical protein
MSTKRVLAKPQTFDEIMSQTQLIDALEKNKFLNNRCTREIRDLENCLSNSIVKLDQEKITNKQKIFELKRELHTTGKSIETKKSEETVNSKNPLNSYIEQIKFDKIDKANYFLPLLIDNINKQRQHSSLTIKDVIKYNLNNFKRSKFLNKINKETNHEEENDNENANRRPRGSRLVKGLTRENTQIQKQEQLEDEKQHESEEQFESSSRPLEAREHFQMPLIQSHYSRVNKSKDRLYPEELAKFYETKMRLLKINRKFEQYKSKCSKKCEYKHPTYLSTQDLSKNSNKLNYFIDDYE